MQISLKCPPMGWNSYDYYDTTVNEAQVKANADFMAKYLKDYGWEYVVVDIAWYSYESGQQRDKFQYVPFAKMEMDEYSRLLPDTERFPSSKGGQGFKPLADYVHSLGLKFGIHIMRGIPRRAAYERTKIKNTDITANVIADPYSICMWNPDMYGVNPKEKGAQEYYDSLLELYAGWGVDFIKCDDICRMDAPSSKAEIEMLHKAIEGCGRDIVLSLSPGPAIVEEHDFYRENANMWRITDDFWDHWASLRDMFDRCRNWQEYVTDGGYPDCDMLPLGMLGKGFGNERKTNFTPDEQKTMMTLWCMFRSPLMLGAELTKLDEETLALLQKAPLYQMLKETADARETYRDEEWIIWESASETDKYMAIFNISEEDRPVSSKLLNGPADLLNEEAEHGETELFEIWSETKMSREMRPAIPAHGVLLFRMEK